MQSKSTKPKSLEDTLLDLEARLGESIKKAIVEDKLTPTRVAKLRLQAKSIEIQYATASLVDYVSANSRHAVLEEALRLIDQLDDNCAKEFLMKNPYILGYYANRLLNPNYVWAQKD